MAHLVYLMSQEHARSLARLPQKYLTWLTVASVMQMQQACDVVRLACAVDTNRFTEICGRHTRSAVFRISNEIRMLLESGRERDIHSVEQICGNSLRKLGYFSKFYLAVRLRLQ